MKHLVIAAMPRSGSTLLAEMLALHPAIMGFTEIFHDDWELRKKTHDRGVGDAGLFAYEGGEYGRPELYLDFLESVAARKRKSVLSYKLMESQCPGLYAELPHRKAYIVHLRRENLVALCASFKIAQATDRWHATKEEHRAQVHSAKVTVTAAEVEEWDRREKAQMEQIKRSRIPAKAISYGEINADPNLMANILFDLIEVAPMVLTPTQMKLNTRPLSEMILNIDGLANALAGTRFDWMTNDDRGGE